MEYVYMILEAHRCISIPNYCHLSRNYPSATTTTASVDQPQYHNPSSLKETRTINHNENYLSHNSRKRRGGISISSTALLGTPLNLLLSYSMDFPHRPTSIATSSPYSPRGIESLPRISRDLALRLPLQITSTHSTLLQIQRQASSKSLR
jgi:hypothetical protein